MACGLRYPPRASAPRHSPRISNPDSSMTSETEVLRYGFVGAGFMTQFHLRALEQVRGVEVGGLVSRRRPEALAQWVRARGRCEAVVYDDVTSMAHDVDVIVICNPNFARVPLMEELAHAV